ncbi:repressor LexA [Candidatus Roizmanbacteria bacterium RIFCSPHIGHO2_12_FULL_33_9]|uniref:LexA repressor n=1 Tax=Candidatus Roizmanbacteria bacterium RIFCSPHIGHO2_12_FULL_33_9 TaxID=1802045 RepID=A0A1F7HJE3_9BACT|nr:MAG: repressor LexA [Candidatus Roizmanbacteria bacterium RIFCSPHIGHO2_12_FULL_33_9]
MKKINRTITPKQKSVFDFIVSFKSKNGYSPSLKEIGHELNLAISTIHQHIAALKNKGYLKKEDNQPRGVSLLEKTAEAVEIPLLGIITAGSPIEPIENPEPIKIPKSLTAKRGNYYALKVQGNSMIDDGIWDGDIVVIKHQQTADNGETVVAVTENGATLKRYRNQNGKIFLEPKNKRLENIYPRLLEIRGKFVGLIRNSI